MTNAGDEIPEGPPEKRRKISGTSETTGNVTLLQSVGNSGCFVAVTGEDKCLRVFEINNDYEIVQLSSRYTISSTHSYVPSLICYRCMQKRPCAIAVSSDNKTIICGDKFGDVYAVPLFPTSDELEMPTPTPSTPASIDSTKSKGPAATLLTVHSGRNRKALENQKRVASQGKTKPASAFKQDLLIGHVSMLTDVAFITLSSTVAAEGKPRSYIISSDRDEHIRISRGPPQAHVIEGFCLGHKEFVSKLAVINEDILVSGGGDDDLFVWNWSKTNLLQKISIRAPLQAILEKSKGILTAGSAQRKIAVNGLWSISGLEPGSDAGGTDYSILLVSLEGIPALFSYECSKLINRWRQDGASIAPTEEPIIPCAMIPLAGNVLDVAIGRNIVVISLDNIHEPWSLDSARTEVVRPPRYGILLHMLIFSRPGRSDSPLSDPLD